MKGGLKKKSTEVAQKGKEEAFESLVCLNAALAVL